MATGAFSHDAPKPILFTNVNVFDGVGPELIENTNVLVDGNLITAVSTEPLAAANARIIDDGGHTLMPGLIESHAQLNLQHMVGGYGTMEGRDWQEICAMAAFTAQSLLMNGFTTVRDADALNSEIPKPG